MVATRRQVACTVAGEAVILHLDNGVYYGLNEVGTRIWQLAQEPRTVARIVDIVSEEFEVGRDECARDVEDLLDALVARGLVEVSDEPHPESRP